MNDRANVWSLSQVEAIAKMLLGEPNRQLSRHGELRYGTHGSRSIDLQKAQWFDHEKNVGGGMLDLVADTLGCAKDDAKAWLRANGFALDRQSTREPADIVSRYPYHDEQGELLFEVVRRSPKRFQQRAPDGGGGWKWSTKGVRKVLFNLPELISADEQEIVFVVEGEKDAERLNQHGLIATTNPGGAGKWRDEYSRCLANRRAVILPDNDAAGTAHAELVSSELQNIATQVAILNLPDFPEKGDVSDWLDSGGSAASLRGLAARALQVTTFPRAAPTPLVRVLSAPSPFPIDALGPLAKPVKAIQTKTQSPIEIAAQSVLAAVSAAAQAHVDVESLDRERPCSLYLITIAQSGERKSACDYWALKPIREFERELYDEFQSQRRKYEDDLSIHEATRSQVLRSVRSQEIDAEDPLKEVGDPPASPREPQIILSEPTLEGIHRSLEFGRPSLALISDEGGHFIGGHAMSRENRLKTAAGLSTLWDGSPYTRVRAGDVARTFRDRRLTIHLMIQPAVSEDLLADELLRDQGILSRCLICKPESKIGTRFISDSVAESQKSQIALDIYDDRVSSLLLKRLPVRPGTTNELLVRILKLEEKAREFLTTFANDVESKQAEGGCLAEIRGVASKAAEQVVRIATVMTVYENETAETVPTDAVTRAVKLMTWYLTEAQRLFGTGQPSSACRSAEKLRIWLCQNWCEPFIDLRTIMRLGPNAIRDSAAARAAVRTLVESGWLIEAKKGADVGGSRSRAAWRVIRA